MTGFALEIPPGTCAIINSSKRGQIRKAIKIVKGIIDEHYRGKAEVIAAKLSGTIVEIEKGQAVTTLQLHDLAGGDKHEAQRAADDTTTSMPELTDRPWKK